MQSFYFYPACPWLPSDEFPPPPKQQALNRSDVVKLFTLQESSLSEQIDCPEEIDMIKRFCQAYHTSNRVPQIMLRHPSFSSSCIAPGLLLVFLPALVVFVVLDIAWIALVIGKMYRVS